MNLNQVTVAAIDVRASVRFYEQLGLQLIVDVLPRYARFVCPEGNATFSIHQIDELLKENTIWVYFECEQLDQKVAYLQAKGMLFEELPTNKSWLWREARLFDPAKNCIILYYAGENRINPPWRINQ